MARIPDRLYIDIDDRALYDTIQQEVMFEGKTRKEQFLFAMAVGFKNRVKRPLETREGGGFFLAKDLHPEDEALMNAVAIHDAGSLDALSDKATVFKIAEEYAHAGIRLLAGKIESTALGSYVKRLEQELHDIYREADAHGRHEESAAG